MDQLVPMKVKIGLRLNGHADHPDFGEVMRALNLSGDWSHYVDRFGGWHYDEQSGHAESDTGYGSPSGMQWGMLFVPNAFAEQAVELFPETCEVIDESAAEAFYDTRAHAHEPDFHEDLAELQKIAALEQLGEDITSRKQRALDPDDPHPGRRRNKRKTFAQYKTQRGIAIDHESVTVLSERRRQALEARRAGAATDSGGAPGP